MNRIIFPILKFNYKNVFINFIFIFFIYLFGFFHLNFLCCDDQLIKTVVNGIAVRHSPSVSPLRLYNSVNFIQQYILNTPPIEYRFNIFRYLQLNNLRFPHTHVYDHYHLNLYLNNMYNVHYGFQFTHNPHKLNLLPNEFSKFNKLDLYGRKQSQFILNDLRMYDLDTLKLDDNSSKFKQFLLDFNLKCISHYKYIIK